MCMLIMQHAIYILAMSHVENKSHAHLMTWLQQYGAAVAVTFYDLLKVNYALSKWKGVCVK